MDKKDLVRLKHVINQALRQEKDCTCFASVLGDNYINISCEEGKCLRKISRIVNNILKTEYPGDDICFKLIESCNSKGCELGIEVVDCNNIEDSLNLDLTDYSGDFWERTQEDYQFSDEKMVALAKGYKELRDRIYDLISWARNKEGNLLAYCPAGALDSIFDLKEEAKGVFHNINNYVTFRLKKDIFKDNKYVKDADNSLEKTLQKELDDLADQCADLYFDEDGNEKDIRKVDYNLEETYNKKAVAICNLMNSYGFVPELDDGLLGLYEGYDGPSKSRYNKK